MTKRKKTDEDEPHVDYDFTTEPWNVTWRLSPDDDDVVVTRVAVVTGTKRSDLTDAEWLNAATFEDGYPLTDAGHTFINVERADE